MQARSETNPGMLILKCEDCGELIFDPRVSRCGNCWSPNLQPLVHARGHSREVLLVWIGMICFWLVLVGWLFSRG